MITAKGEIMSKIWYYGKDAISDYMAIKEPKRESIHVRMERRAAELIKEVGVSERIKGFNYLRKAIMLVIYDPDIIHYMMTELYVKVAEEYHTTPSRVERAMRFALACGWNKLFLGEAESDDWDAEHKPSNSEFIAAVANKVKLEFKYISKPRYTTEEFLKKYNK